MERAEAQKCFDDAINPFQWEKLQQIITEYPEAIKWTVGSGTTALHWAAISGNARAARWLLGHGAEIDRQDEQGETTLHFAAKHSHDKIVGLLCLRGAQLELKDYLDNTPLLSAAKSSGDNPKSVDILLISGANIDALDREQRTPLLAAQTHQNESIAALLEEVLAARALAAEQEKQRRAQETIDLFRNGLDVPVTVFAKPVVPIKRSTPPALQK